MTFLPRRIQCWLKHFFRAIQYSAAISLVLFLIYWCTRIVPHERARNAVVCSANTFLSSEGCRPCPRGMFSFSGWSACLPWLDCTDISRQVQPQRRLGGFVKEIWLADWNGHQVVYANCTNICPYLDAMCWHGTRKMEQLQGDFVARLIGKCFDKQEIVTAYYKHGDLGNLDKVLEQPQYSHYDNIQTRFQLSVDYVKIINFLHTSPVGVLVMCDASTMYKVKEQYLITDDFHLILNDLDVLPEVNPEEGKFVICYPYEEDRPIAAPEQMWPNKSINFTLELMPPYDEKIDIWKIPAVVESFLDEVKGGRFAKSQLSQIMERCHAIDPVQRPTANEVLQELLRVQHLIDERRYLSTSNRILISRSWRS